MLRLPGYEGGTVERLAFTPDGEWLASQATHPRGRDRSAPVRWWNRFTGLQRYLPTLPGYCEECLTLSADGRLAAWASGNAVFVWDVEHGGVAAVFRDLRPYAAAAFNRDGSQLAIVRGHGSTILVHDVGTESLVSELRPWLPLTHGLAFAPGDRTLALITRRGEVAIVAVTGGTPLARTRLEAPPSHVAFTGDGKQLVAATGKTVRAWDVAGFDKRFTLEADDRVTGLAISADDRTLATSAENGTVACWDLATGELRHQYRWPLKKAGPVAFAPDGLTAAVGGEGGKIVVWDLDEP